MQKSQKRVKNILIASTSSDYGGGPKVVYDFLSHTSRKDFRYVVVAPEGAYQEKFRKLGLSVYQLPLNKINLKTFWDFYKLLKLEQIDLLNSHGKGAGLYARISGFFARVPVVQTFHGIHFSLENKISKYVYLTLEKILCKFTKLFINDSNGQEKLGIELGIFPKEKSRVVFNGVDINYIDSIDIKRKNFRKSINLNDDAVVLVFVARFDKVKGHLRFIKLLPNILDANPKLKIVFVGDGDLKDQSEELVRELQIEKNVIFLGYRKDIYKIYKASDMFILPSFREGMPLSIPEAMVCRLPIIGSDAVGVAELIREGDTGFVIDFENHSEKLNFVITKLYKDKNLRQEIGSQARDHAINNFSLEKFVLSTENIYEEVLSENNIK